MAWVETKVKHFMKIEMFGQRFNCFYLLFINNNLEFYKIIVLFRQIKSPCKNRGNVPHGGELHEIKR